jgi:hypothetical protein
MTKNALLIRILFPFVLAAVAIPFYAAIAVKVIDWLNN